MTEPVLKIEGLKTCFTTKRGMLTAVDRVSLHVNARETLGIVGESGCGKSVTALSVLQLLPKPLAHIEEGKVLFNGKDLVSDPDIDIRAIRGNQISMIFQEPMTSLNPVYNVGFQIMEPLRKHRNMGGADARLEAIRLLELVGIPEPVSRIADYPHQLSGGMRQRVMIAIALACQPALIIADEPTTALDVTIQAQILELMKSLQQELGMAIMLITHDLGVVAETCHRVVVMYAGKIVESADVDELFTRPLHPYTKGLFDSLPQRGRRSALSTIPGAVPSLLNLPEGCSFQDRCRYAVQQCKQVPPWQETDKGHGVRCWYALRGELR
ncbi:ABC transporter ATP-binding protein [Desulfopila sp. IMCC35008]|uniref:ABC transporter ATP-binding protein n=1 Tax=Desulfopila sp. IMCC35008 TaxID=2653858 RepID=UPI0013D30675|nr:ABC transporter ATP-binding protein [Desulfopila sp. IMCC35008]